MVTPGMLIVEVKRCISCKRCMIECAVAHSQSKELAAAMQESPRPQSRVLVRQVGEFSAPYQCRHCEQPPCVPVCPNGALERDPERSVVLLDLQACAGAGKCVKKCPFLGIVMDRTGQRALKCDLCTDRLEQGGIPACAEACPTGALTYKAAEDLTEAERAYYSGRPGAALVRRQGIRYEIDAEKCIACRKCALVCPAEAVEGAKKTPHKILQERCITCGACFLSCPVDAIRALAPEAFEEAARLGAAARVDEPSAEMMAAAAEAFAPVPEPEPEVEPEAEPEPPAAEAPPATPRAVRIAEPTKSKKERRLERKIRRKDRKAKGKKTT